MKPVSVASLQYEDYLRDPYWLAFRELVHIIYGTGCLYPFCDDTHITTAHLIYPDRYHERFDLVLPLCKHHHFISDGQGVEFLPFRWILPKQKELLEAWRTDNADKEQFCDLHHRLEFRFSD
jgi:hypothetical protein